MNVQIHSDKPGRFSIKLDDYEVNRAVSGFILSGEGGKTAELTLDLLVVPLHYEGEAEVRLHMSDEARVLLVRDGWVPPSENGVRD